MPPQQTNLKTKLDRQTLGSLNRKDINRILGDFNAKIGKGRRDKYVGEYGLRTRN